MHNVAVYIPAKGSSTGIPGKNLQDLGGRPLVAWSIDSGLTLANPKNVFVSTDDKMIAALTTDRGARVLERPAHLAAQSATVAQCLAHDLHTIGAVVGTDGIIAVLLPTSPFRDKNWLQDAIARFGAAPDAHSLVAVRQFPAPIEQALAIDDADWLEGLSGSLDLLHSRSRRQEHAIYYYPDGSLYLVRARMFRSNPCFFLEGATLGFRSDGISAIDIDDLEDLELARLIAAVQAR
jgi:CMP-N-acetylneuraminic acid synthetase